MTIEMMVCTNIKQYCVGYSGVFTIKCDEIATAPRVRWCPETNEFTGLCFNHKSAVNSLKFDNYIKLMNLNDKLRDGKIHLAKETLVFTVGKVDRPQDGVFPVLILPICSHTNLTVLNNMT